MKKDTFIFLLLLIMGMSSSTATSIRPGRYLLNHIDGRSGLSENMVKSILQDSWGFVWLGTKNGLNRYDGFNIKHYDVDDVQKKVGNHNISALYEAPDHRIWVGTDKGVFVYNRYQETFDFFDKKTDKGVDVSNWVNQIVGDKHGNIWIIVPNQGAFRYDTRKKKLHLYSTSREKETYEHNIQSMCLRNDGTVWFGTDGNGIFKYNYQNDKMEDVLPKSLKEALANKNIFTMTDYGEWIVLGEHEARLEKYNPTTKELKDVDAPNVHYKVIRAVAYDGDKLYVGTQDGLFIIDETKQTEEQLKENIAEPFGLSDNMIYSIYCDRHNGIWIGTMHSGANYLSKGGMHFTTFFPSATPGSLSSKLVHEMVGTDNGDVWINTEDGFVNIYHPAIQTFENVEVPIYKGGTGRLALMNNGTEIWSGLFKNGLDVITISNHTVRHYSPQELQLDAEPSVYALYKAHNGKVWLGTARGIYIQDKDMRFTKVKSIPDMYTQDIVQDQQENIWICTIGTGVYRLNLRTGRVSHFTHHADDPKSLSSNDVSSVTIDHLGNLWFATDRGGICKYDAQLDHFVSYGKAEGLPDDVAYKIIEDVNHFLWFGTNQGLVRFNPTTLDVTVYRNTNGLFSNQYTYKSAYKHPDGTFLFGSYSGLVAFNPQPANKNLSKHRIYITNIQVDNIEVKPGVGDVLETNIVHARKIKLPYDFSSLHLDISSMNFSGSEAANYEYKIEGVDKKWNSTTASVGINYTRLQPGRYKLKIREAGYTSNMVTLNIIVLYPWWSSVWARLIYLLVAVLLGWYLYKSIKQRQRRTLSIRASRLREAQEKELLQSKISFFTNITHEIRTPLTLISGSLENIHDEKIEDKGIEKSIRAVKLNCQRLLNLIDQLLDFRKMDAKSLQMNFVNMDVCELVRNIITHFEPTIVNQNKTISLDVEEDSITLPINPEILTKIISNLLNNAMKYSETFIQVNIRRTSDSLLLTVLNDGQKIPIDKVEEIFVPFTRLDHNDSKTGTGIGLPLARSLAEQHNGSLTLDTTSEYNSFVLNLPLYQDNVMKLDKESLNMNETSLDSIVVEDFHVDNTNKKEHTLLIVEDNAEIIDLIRDNLGEYYNVLIAYNGEEALEMMNDHRVNLIISDIMMPVMDGLELTRRIKSDFKLSHIPVILLTARQTLGDNIEGLQAGADAYIKKPFNFVYLQTQIKTLLDNRKREQESFLHMPHLLIENSGINNVEEKFLNKISNLIISNMHDPSFNVERLASEMCMSRSSLHRKIREVSNLTPIDFIRLIKLKKAAELIREHGYRTTEVCDKIGISSPSYFIKLFQKQFGMTPKEFASKKTDAHTK
ncbi:response regulator receiver domain protein [Bacteroidales bacterium KA00344]|nr:response regulator receiver domain protein [Bacteroidales bacterium KA00344]